jgi:phosphohistidine phosphatase
MKTLLLLRHAKSSWKDDALPDHDRPLNGRGRRDAPRVGRHLLEEGLVPDVVVASTAERARRTAEAVAEVSGFAGGVRLEAALYAATPGAILGVVRALPDEVRTALLVGHNPGLEALASALAGRQEILPTAALARFEIAAERWQDAGPPARLVSVWRPRDPE